MADKTEPKDQRHVDREAEEAQQEAVRKAVFDATHEKDGSPKPLPQVILP